MDALTALKTRRSVRVYQDKPIPKEVLEDIIDCARLAPTAMNRQPWAFVVVTEKETRQRIAAWTDFGQHIAQAAACVAVFCEDTKYFLEDGSAATQNILLAAWAHGIGSCWVAGDKKAYAEPIRQLLGLPEHYKLVSLIPLGYPADVPPKDKRPLADVLHWERYRGQTGR
ncbi:MAG: nitroreductase family protein [Abditibacteriales bacterium]|nr:nitroreductase family protein [Abditibacteriales bacterium]MDW8368304.1 nitroreductase family protein [Abditibacteriales bacterium]